MSDAAVSPFIAFVAGFASILSPCVLPVAPLFALLVGGLTLVSQKISRGLRLAAPFLVGFLGLFVVVGASATELGNAARRALPLLQPIGGGALLALGALIASRASRTRAARDERRSSHEIMPLMVWVSGAAALVAGVGTGAGWTPCVGPVLSTILLDAARPATMNRGVVLLTIYAIGLGVPFVLIGLAGAGVAAALRRVRRVAVVTAGTIVAVTGILLMTGRFAHMTAFLAGFGQLFELEP